MARKVAVFIDGAYLDFTLHDDFKGPQIDYGQLPVRLAKDMDLLRTYYYHCAPHMSPIPTTEERDRYEKKMGFFHKLSSLPRFEVKLGKLECRRSRVDATASVIGTKREDSLYFEQKRVDTAIAVDMVMLSIKQRITDAILLAADSDLLPAVKAVREEGVFIWLVSGKKHPAHKDLWSEADERITLEQNLIDQILRV